MSLAQIAVHKTENINPSKLDQHNSIGGGTEVPELFDLYVIRKSDVYPYSPEPWAIGDTAAYGGRELHIRNLFVPFT